MSQKPRPEATHFFSIWGQMSNDAGLAPRGQQPGARSSSQLAHRANAGARETRVNMRGSQETAREGDPGPGQPAEAEASQCLAVAWENVI